MSGGGPSALGRLLPFKSGLARATERPASVRAEIRPGWVSTYRPQPVIRVELG